MNKEFDFGHIGKRMPYSTPDGFFDQLEEDIRKEVKPAKSHSLLRTVLAVAASVALIVTSMNFPKSDKVSINDVDQAFSQLTADDQDYLLDIYQEDVFINE